MTATAVVHLIPRSAAVTGHHQQQKTCSGQSRHHAQLVGLGPRTLDPFLWPAVVHLRARIVAQIRRSRARGFKSLSDTNPLGMMRCRQSCGSLGRGALIPCARPGEGCSVQVSVIAPDVGGCGSCTLGHSSDRKLLPADPQWPTPASDHR